MTSQPKDMEQLKKEIKDYIFLNEKGEIDLDLTVVVQRLLTRFSDKAHRSGRESMRDECVEKVKKEAATYKKVYLSAAFGRALASALKKIKP